MIDVNKYVDFIKKERKDYVVEDVDLTFWEEVIAEEFFELEAELHGMSEEELLGEGVVSAIGDHIKRVAGRVAYKAQRWAADRGVGKRPAAAVYKKEKAPRISDEKNDDLKRAAAKERAEKNTTKYVQLRGSDGKMSKNKAEVVVKNRD